MCVALTLSTTTMAQQTTPAPVATEQATAKRGTKITFPPNAMAKMKTFGDVELVSDLMNTTVTIVGNSEDGVVLETANGEKVLMNRTRKSPPRLIRIPPSLRWTPIVPKPTSPTVYTLTGIDEKNNAVWSCPSSKGRCLIDETTGKKVDYIGHVTFLR